MIIITNRTVIADATQKNEEENFHFKAFLRTQDTDAIDRIVAYLNDAITPKIDCTQCSNCCKSLMINVTHSEVSRLSNHLNISENTLKEKYIETSLQGDMIINTIPCHFLTGSKCSIYEYRFAECREFPGLHKKGFIERLFPTFVHYGRCPIIYNVVEELKLITNYKLRTPYIVLEK